MNSYRTKSAFSLVELSIVLVILGLLTGGILGGQALIRAAELRSVSADYSSYVTAVRSFQDKYLAMPGDMTNATAFWGTMSSGTCPNATGGVGTETCNGNGDGLLAYPAAANQSGEIWLFWQHLANAGLIQGRYSGIAGSAGFRAAVIGTNVPAGRLSRTGFGAENFGPTCGACTAVFPGDYRRIFVFGRQGVAVPPELAALRPEEAWNIDTKLDDARAVTGTVRAYRGPCLTTDVASTADYALANGSIACTLVLSY